MSEADIELGDVPLLSRSGQISIKIKYQNKDYEVNLSAQEVVSELIDRFKQLLPPLDTYNKNIRLIYSGKLLSPPRLFIFLLTHSFVHILIVFIS